jgi:N-acetylneuraminate synthase/N,N'-diacetyllegionaminate synthase
MEVCAEIGINHGGDMDLAHEMIRQAAICGADYVKFQLYDPREIFADEPHLIEEGLECMITREHFDRILEWSYEEGIEPFFSVFDEERLEWTEDADVLGYKLASRSVKKTPDFCRKVLDLGKDTYVSLGMSTIAEAHFLQGYDNARFLYCVSKYPAEYSDYYDQPFDYEDSFYYGISDHTMGIETSLAAAGRGAQFIEKHFTLSKTLKGSDHKCSITPDELADLVKYARLINKAIGG